MGPEAPTASWAAEAPAASWAPETPAASWAATGPRAAGAFVIPHIPHIARTTAPAYDWGSPSVRAENIRRPIPGDVRGRFTHEQEA